MIIRQEQLFSQIERYVTKKFDEVNIQENVIWEKHSGVFLGFVGLDHNNVATSKHLPEMSYIFV